MYSSSLVAHILFTTLAFGFVYVHPFEDGNGRIHRYLIHHVLAQRGFNPAGVVFPVSAAILDRIDDYRTVLEDYSRRLLPLIRWEPMQDGNVRVLNDTGDYYRYFDATPHAEFLYGCVQTTIDSDLPRETAPSMNSPSTRADGQSSAQYGSRSSRSKSRSSIRSSALAGWRIASSRPPTCTVVSTTR